jgi:phosphopantothenoylcysteine decarboxylase/phosphopantothenate--cysteine ligase
MMTANAARFVTPLTLAALSGNQVMTSLWQPMTPDVATHEPGSFEIEHIRATQDADVLVVAPATANFIATLAHGFANDVVSATCLAATIPIVVAPAMNVNMWSHPATQANMDTLRQRGVHVIAPASGELACGMVGDGRLAEPVDIADGVYGIAGIAQSRDDMADETILITAGGTREPIDAVRFIGNRSSGKMGFALAEASLARGARVILVSAASTTSTPAGCEIIRVATASEMEDAVMAQLPRASAVIMAAAVSDYRVLSPSAQKVKKAEKLTLELTQTTDILRQVMQRRCAGTLVVGFAAETDHVLAEGRRKLREKGVDMIVANDVSRSDIGFDSDQNAGTILSADEEIVLPLSSKRVMADRIVDQMQSLRKKQGGSVMRPL